MNALMKFTAACGFAAIMTACSMLSQVKQDEALLPPTAAAIADAYGSIQLAGALGQQACMVTQVIPKPTCIRLQGQLLAALQQVQAVEALIDSGSATASDAATLAAAQAAIQAVITQLQAVTPQPKV